MQRKLLEILACPKCKGDLNVDSAEADLSTAELTCRKCAAIYPIINGIPRFVPMDNYASSFGYQWNRFRKEQVDSFNGTTLSADRLWSETGWTPEELDGKWVLDVGCGAGRFLDAASKSNGKIVGVDISSAVDAARENMANRGNVEVAQASIYDLPFRDGVFDYVYCIGVIQHTPDRDMSLQSIAKMVRPGGGLAVTIYPRKPWTKLFSKYWIRPFTKRMKKETLLKSIEAVMPIAFPLTNVLFRIPILGKVFIFTIPIANYVNERNLSREQRYAWAVLDTFDMLSPAFDEPMTEEEAAKPLREAGLEVIRQSDVGVNLVGIKHDASA